MEVGNQHLFNLSAKSLYTLISERNKAVILRIPLSAISQPLRCHLKRTSVKNRKLRVEKGVEKGSFRAFIHFILENLESTSPSIVDFSRLSVSTDQLRNPASQKLRRTRQAIREQRFQSTVWGSLRPRRGCLRFGRIL